MKGKLFITMVAIATLLFVSCEKEDLQIPNEGSSINSSFLGLKITTGWVMQPIWNYSKQDHKIFNIGNKGLVVTATNTGTAETIICVQEIDGLGNYTIENTFRVTPSSNGELSTAPDYSTKKIIITTIRAGGYGSVSGSIIVNSKY